MTVTAAMDDNKSNESVTLTHTATSSDLGYNSLAEVLAVTVTDNDQARLSAPLTLSVTEGSQETFAVSLSSVSSEEVNVVITGHVGTSLMLDNDGDLNTPFTGLTFSPTNWNTRQTLMVTAAQDANTNNETVTLTLTASGGNYNDVTHEVTITIVDFDMPTSTQVGTCTTPLGEAYLDINNVRARILNNGNLFWRGSPNVYNVPKGGGAQAMYTSGIWIGGNVGGQLRVAAARYGNYHFWAGPLDDDGSPPADCSQFDRLYKVSLDDIQFYEATGGATPDLVSWPTGLGAPTYAAPGNQIDDDGDGVVDEEGEMIFVLNQPMAQRVNRVINLLEGERPAIFGRSIHLVGHE